MIRLIPILFSLLLLCTCDSKKQSANPTNRNSTTRVACLVPAMTDLLVAMNCQDHLAAVSNYDSLNADLPRVGDYRGPDWETLATVHADVMVIQIDPSRLPRGFIEKADRLRMKLANIRFDTVDDVLRAVESAGQVIGENDKASQLKNRLTAELNQVRDQSKIQTRVRVLMMMDTTGHALIGDGNFLSDLLNIAGGENVVTGMGPWPTGDLELLLQLKPDVILCLMPDMPGDLPGEVKKNLSRLQHVPAISRGHVYAITDHSVLLPGAQIGRTAQNMQEILRKSRKI